MVKDLKYFDALAKRNHYVNQLHCGKCIFGPAYGFTHLSEVGNFKVRDFATLVDLDDLDDCFREMDECTDLGLYAKPPRRDLLNPCY